MKTNGCLILIFLFFNGCRILINNDSVTQGQTLDNIQDSVVSVAKSEKPLKDIKGEQPIRGNKDSIRTYAFYKGWKLKVVNHDIVIYTNSDVEVAANSNIIKTGHEKSDCPYEGFIEIRNTGIYFTIEQQNCSGWDFIEEFITFKYSEVDGKILLHNFTLIYTDRRDPEKEIPARVYTEKDFGNVYFENVNLDSLYSLNR